MCRMSLYSVIMKISIETDIIKLTDFCIERLFDYKKPGTTIENLSPLEFEMEIHTHWAERFCREQKGYAPFCKLVFMKNWIDSVKAGTVPITCDNQHLIKTEYLARTEKEIPVLTRWIKTDNVPKAEYLVLVLYSREQIEKELKDQDKEDKFEADWGVVAVLGQVSDEEEPMSPITMMRNALGTAEGGSGHPLNREAYMESVKFWRSHAVVKSH